MPEAAPLGRRIVAGLLDLLVTIAIFLAFAAATGGLDTEGSSVSADVTGGPAVLLFAVVFLYYFLTEWRTGASPGKHALGLRVVGEDGAPATGGRIALRTLLRAIDGILFYLVGVIAAAASPRNQRIGDMAGRTLVVRR